MTKRHVAARVVGAALLVWCAWYLYSHFDWVAVLAILGRANRLWLFGATGAAILSYFLVRTLRWRVVIRHDAPNVGLPQLYLITAIAVGLGLLTPGKLGEAIKIDMLTRKGGPNRIVGTGVFLAERLVDAGIIGSVALIGLVVYMPRAELKTALLASVGLVSVVAATLVVVPRARLWNSLHQLAMPLVALGRDRTALIRVILLTLTGWSLVGLGWSFALKSVGVSLGFLHVMWLVSVIAVAGVVSFIPGSVGIAELVAVKVLVNAGYSPDIALAGAISIRIYGLLTIALASLHLAYDRLSSTPPLAEAEKS